MNTAYGRPRVLHLEAGLAVAQIAPYAAHLHQHLTDGHIVPLVNGPYFQLDRTYGPPDAALCARYAGPLIALPIDCPITIQGEPIEAGACGVANAISDIHFADTGHCLIAQAISA